MMTMTTAAIAGAAPASVPSESALVVSVVDVVLVGCELVAVVDVTINHVVRESPLLQNPVTVRLSPMTVETLNVSFIPQLNDWFS